MASERRLIPLQKRIICAWEVFAALMKKGLSCTDAADFVKSIPTVDAVEVVRGRWEKSEYNGFVRCDKCKDVYIDESWLTDGKWNYCPNCGAKMDGGNG